jgi:hypothetical protein
MAIVAVGVVVVVVVAVAGFVALRKEPKDHLTRLVFVKTDQTNGQRVVTFRLHVPKHKQAMIAEARMRGVEVVAPSTMNISWVKTLPSSTKSRFHPSAGQQSAA